MFACLVTWQPKQLQVISKVVIGQEAANFSPSSESLESFLFLVKVFLMAPQRTFRVCVNTVSTGTKHTFCVHFSVVLVFLLVQAHFVYVPVINLRRLIWARDLQVGHSRNYPRNSASFSPPTVVSCGSGRSDAHTGSEYPGKVVLFRRFNTKDVF